MRRSLEAGSERSRDHGGTMLSGLLNLLSPIIQEGLPTFPEVALLLMGWTLPY